MAEGRVNGQRTECFNRSDQAAPGANTRRYGDAAGSDPNPCERTSRPFIEFFTASIRNPNTRTSYARAVKQFFDWCDARDLGLDDIEPIAISAYIELLVGHGNGQALGEAASGRDPSVVRLSADRRHSAVESGRLGTWTEICDGARQDAGTFRR